MSHPDVPSDLQQYRIPNIPPHFYYIPSFLSEPECTSLLTKLPPNRWVQLAHRRLQAWPSPLTATSTLLSAPMPTYLTTPILGRFAALHIFSETPHGAPNHCLVNEYRIGEGIMPHEDGAAYAPVVATVSLGGAVVLEIWDNGVGNDVANTAVQQETDVTSPISSGEGVDRKQVPFNPMDAQAYADNPIPAGGTQAHSTASRESVVETEHGQARPLYRILQEPGSLLVTTGEAYTDYLHGISPVEVDVDLGPATVANWDLLGEKNVFADGTNTRVTRKSLTYRDVLKVKDARRILGMKR